MVSKVKITMDSKWREKYSVLSWDSNLKEAENFH